MFGSEIWLVAALAVVIAGVAYALWRRRVRRVKTEADWDKLYPLW